MNIKRSLEQQMLSAKEKYPIITLLGPRQSGKTTLCKKTFPNLEYRSLEDPDVRLLAQSDPRKFLENLRESGAILDEVQRVPDLLSYIQGIVDEDKKMGQFILTGSSQILLLDKINQSLAGRTLLLTLLPLSNAELEREKIKPKETDTLILNGFFPAIYDRNLDPTPTYRSYYQTYVERDVREVANIENLDGFQKLIKLCAGRIGQLLNIASLATEVGISQPTAKKWLSVLETSFVIFRLHPYHENFHKRVVKSQKLYFYDVGLATYLLEISNTSQLSRDPLRGHLFENMVIADAMKHRFNHNQSAQYYFFRDNHGLEVDLLYRAGNQIHPIEIKSTQTFRPELSKGLRKFQELDPNRMQHLSLVYDGQSEQEISGVRLINYKSLDQIL